MLSLNVTGLEDILQSFQTEITKLVKRVDTNENFSQMCVSNEKFSKLESSFGARLLVLESKVDGLEEKLGVLEKLTFTVDQNEKKLERVEKLTEKQISSSAFEEKLGSSENHFDSKLEKLKRKCGSAHTVEKLELAQRDMLRKQLNLEQGLCTKMDKSELPLIEALASRIEVLGENIEANFGRFENLDAKLDGNIDRANEKVDKSEFDRKVGEVMETVRSKTDVSFAKEKLLTPLSGIKSYLDQFENFDPAKASTLLSTITEKQSELLETISNQQSLIETLNEQTQLLSSSFESHKSTVSSESVLSATKEKIESGLQSRFANLTTQIEQLKKVDQSLQKQVKVALKFVDWYSSIEH